MNHLLRFLFPFLLVSKIASADPGCIDANIISGKLITDMCWDCIFPLRIGGVPMPGGSGDPAPAEAV